MTVPAESAPFGALLTPMPMRTAGERVAERFVTAIALGEFVSGQRLPTERELAALLAVSRRPATCGPGAAAAAAPSSPPTWAPIPTR